MEFFCRRSISLLFCLCCAVVFSPSGIRAQPTNDMFTNAMTLSGASGTISGSNVDATGETGEPDHANSNPFRSVWYIWTADADRIIEISTSGSSFDTTLAVYTGASVDSLTLVANNDDTLGLQSQVSFPAQQGVTYRIAVDGFAGAQGDIVLSWVSLFKISGTISLPNGAVESQEIPISLGALYLPSNGQYATTLSGSYNTLVTLPPGTNSVYYEFALPLAIAGDPGGYLIGYNQDNPNYVHFGYYHPDGSVGLISNSHLLPVGQDYTEINLQLIEGKEISGTISLPGDSVAPPEGIDVTLGTVQEPDGLHHTTVTILPDTTSVDYSIRVAQDVGEVALSYVLSGETPFAPRGYYSASSTMASKVTGSYALADRFASTSDFANQDFVLDYGNQISGVIHTAIAADRDVPVEIILSSDPADPDTIYWHTAVNIKAGTQTLEYSQRVVLDSAIVAQYSNLHYQPWTPAGFYYDNTGSVPAAAAATRLAAANDHSAIDLFIGETLPGDLNYDGVVDLKDAILGLQTMTGVTILDGLSTSADVNDDGVLGLPEVIHILNQL